MTTTFNRRRFLETVAAGTALAALPKVALGDHGEMHKYCILVSVVSGDTKQALKTLMEGVDAKLIGRDEEPTEPGLFNRYVLGTQNVAATLLDNQGNPLEIDANVIIGLNHNVPNSVLVELVKQNPAYRQIAFNPPETRETIVSRLRQHAGEIGCDHVWVVQPGDSTVALTNTALLAKFEAL